MRKFIGKILLCGILAVTVMFAGTLLVQAGKEECKTEPPEGEMVIKDPAWEEHTKCPVSFNHTTHAEEYDLACTDCHHKYENGENVWEEGDPACPCSSCHTNLVIKGEKRLPEAEQKLNLKLAYHDNCVDCHRALKKENRDTAAPTTCTQCHPRECE